MTPDEVYDELVAGFPKRKFSPGLLIAFIDFYQALGVPGGGYRSLADVLVRFPRRHETAARHRANQLIVELPKSKTLGLRPFYNAVQRSFHAEHKRFDYPSCPAHATQAWIDYVHWLDALAQFTPEQLMALRQRLVEFVLDSFVSQAFDPAAVAVDPPLFQLLLEGFDTKARRGEPTGAAFQGIVFGFLRADNPHLQIEIDKVRTGSKRLHRVGDVDGWEGARLAISAEVKQFVLKEDHIPDLEPFANAIGRRGALGLIVALGFEEGVKDLIEAMGLKPLDSDDLARIVELWDPLKQRTATSSLVYYARHVERKSALADRIEQFLNDEGETFLAARQQVVEPPAEM